MRITRKPKNDMKQSENPLQWRYCPYVWTQYTVAANSKGLRFGFIWVEQLYLFDEFLVFLAYNLKNYKFGLHN